MRSAVDSSGAIGASRAKKELSRRTAESRFNMISIAHDDRNCKSGVERITTDEQRDAIVATERERENRVERLTYSVKEAAQALGVGETIVYQLVHRADFPTVKIGTRQLISREGLKEWVRRNTAGGAEA